MSTCSRIFYHYGSVNGLLEAAATEITEQRALVYRQRLSTVTSLAELARRLHDDEHQLGNVAVMAQLLAGAHTHPELAPVARANCDLLAKEVRDTLQRLLADTALAAALPADHLAHGVSAAFIGIELLSNTEDARSCACSKEPSLPQAASTRSWGTAARS